ncbi:MAG: hypothetical protein ACW98K_07000 [Candidatus Kariarchaeaceae archaeon]|jgi:hypothetical protein
MSTLSEQLFQNPTGRTAMLSLLIALFLSLFAWVIPIATLEGDPWYSFLYEQSWLLVFVESLLFTLFYFFALIFFGSLQELRNNLPSWGEVFISAIITLGLAYFLPRFTTGGTVQGTTQESGVSHFSSSMQTAVFWFTAIGIILMTLYVIYSGENEEE